MRSRVSVSEYIVTDVDIRHSGKKSTFLLEIRMIMRNLNWKNFITISPFQVLVVWGRTKYIRDVFGLIKVDDLLKGSALKKKYLNGTKIKRCYV